ncbi:hypothetical protein HRI_001925400 [Hibiscus trionum]|uniref:Uncharacterized protein n=1 Tax=Hibiscus trionum TaxID=183268 RepID=A0A9W7HSE6_HIBTR|nr:hypothetical protein HRI_001925400 [Hibiscus trionum]
MVEPQPSFLAYREASFGHGIFGSVSRTEHMPTSVDTEIKIDMLSNLILSGFTTDIETPLRNLLKTQ